FGELVTSRAHRDSRFSGRGTGPRTSFAGWAAALPLDLLSRGAGIAAGLLKPQAHPGSCLGGSLGCARLVGEKTKNVKKLGWGSISGRYTVELRQGAKPKPAFSGKCQAKRQQGLDRQLLFGFD